MPTALVLKPVTKDLGDFAVRRVLPSQPHRTIGPFIFFDHMGPAVFPPSRGIDVRPHPHIGLATVTYLFEGALVHRDSLGFVQRIEPGDVNWMIAGQGIVHSERTAVQDRAGGQRMHGIQTWIALPRAEERCAPAFSHHPKESLPVIDLPGVSMRLILGTAFAQQSPVQTYAPMFYLAVEMAAGACFDLPPEHEERAVYLAEGALTVNGDAVDVAHLIVLPPGETVRICAQTPARIMLLGGARLDGDRIIWWNFVASSRELIEEAKQRWRERRFPDVPGEHEFIPLPE